MTRKLGPSKQCFTWFCVFSIKNILEIYMELKTMLTTQINIFFYSIAGISECNVCSACPVSQRKCHIGNRVLKDSIKPCYHMFK